MKVNIHIQQYAKYLTAVYGKPHKVPNKQIDLAKVNLRKIKAQKIIDKF